MRTLMGLLLAGGIVVGSAGESKAQFQLSIGGPGYGYANGYSNYSGIGTGGYYNAYNSYANSAYLAGPGVMSYSSGYSGVSPYGYGVGAPYATPYAYSSGYRGYAPGYGAGYGYRPGRPNYGYRGYGVGRGIGIPGLRGFGGMFR